MLSKLWERTARSARLKILAARFPSVHCQLQEPLDLAWSWLALEPYTHHVPMPLPLLLATLSNSLLWGWVREAGIFALAWGGRLRTDEATQARQADLVLAQHVLLTGIEGPGAEGTPTDGKAPRGKSRA